MNSKNILIRNLVALLLVAGAVAAFGQDIRSIDGRGNNLVYRDWGATSTNFINIVPYAYSDSVSEPAGVARPNPREVSNVVFAQSGPINDRLALSDYVWVFGQFLDHDVVLSEIDPAEPIFIPVPAGDPVMDPMGTGQVVIPLFRNEWDPATGTGPDNPRVHINRITSFIDGSAVYGDDVDRASWLRSFENGKLKTSPGNLLPFNTITGDFNAPTDPTAPFMGDDVGIATKLFVAGDVRANENPLLITFHTLFVREHNRLCDIYKEQHPDWDDERIYNKARSVNSGLIQSVVYNEWLPAMGVHIPEYTGYHPGVDPSVSNIFAVAAFRLGHTLLSSEIVRLDENGDVIPQGNIGLRDAFFNPMDVALVGGLDPYIRGMGVQIQQNLDCHIIDDVRNFLFGPPGAGGLDLAAINIMRGRERGLPDFNTVRTALGLEPYTEFRQVCNNDELVDELTALYGTVDNIDPWVGLLAEDHMPTALFGETIMTIMMDQFTRLRDGDRFFYLNDPALTEEERAEISDTRMSDIIRRNTGVRLMQENVFFAMEHDDIPFARAEVTRRNLDVAAFPNPARDWLNIKTFVRDAGPAIARIFDANGRVVMEREYEFVDGINTFSIDIQNNLVNGNYVIQLEQDGAYNAVRFVKL